MNAKGVAPIGLFAFVLWFPRFAHAEPDLAACARAYESGQERRLEKKLLQAREDFRVCAGAACPEAVSSQCAAWLRDVDRDLPSVVIAVRDATGRDRPDVGVELDGKKLETERLGEAIELDPGPHVVEVVPNHGARMEQRFVAAEGDKRRTIAVILPAPETRSRPEPKARPASRRDPVLGWVLLGVGAGALGGATYFWVSAKRDYDHFRSSCEPDCSASDQRQVRTKALAGDILGGVAFASLALGGYLVLTAAPRDSGYELRAGGRF